MPRGGRRKGSGRKRLGKMRVPFYLNPEIVFVLRIIATIRKISMGEACEKIMVDPDFVKITSDPDFVIPLPPHDVKNFTVHWVNQATVNRADRFP
jgi:hypothetical protein